MLRKLWQTPTALVTIICLIYVSLVLVLNEGDPKAFILLGTQFSEGDPLGTEGYDGQFAYQIAVNPSGAAPFLDVPAYRYQRILYPLLARLLALGQPVLIPWTLIIVNVLAIGLGTWATEGTLRHFHVNRWYALAYGLYGGHMLTLRADLNESVAHAFVQVAMLAWIKERRWLAVLAFALAALSKETTLIFWAAYIAFVLIKRQWRWVISLGLAPVPFFLYQLFLWQWLGAFGIGSGGAGATPFSLIPLGGWLEIAGVSLAAFWLISLVVFPMSVLPSLIGVWLSARRLWQKKLDPLILSLLLNSSILLFLPMSTFREPIAMLRLTLGVVAAMILFGALHRSRRILNYSLFWIATNMLLIQGVAGG